ncbi:glycosyltransferase family 1 protein [Sphingomonas sp. dw_22]|uniref:glycosyltransferase family 4 protein n=1 Tax=Sphingomonas sp. dw_22 TaxID=2721175 RepID=UPI001BD1EB83|nr:glycosyltransferase family 1 protein [Sphingomonas sp. dw_22]
MSNVERLRLLYDPNYVGHVGTLNGGAPVQVCMESRMLNDQSGTGVATYARVLADCLAAAGAEPLILDDGRQFDPHPRSRVARWLSAARGSGRTAVAVEPSATPAPTQWIARDIFKEAQVFFNIHGRPLPVTFDRPPEVMHWTYPTPIYVVGAKNLYTVHDLIPLAHPHLTPIPTTRHRSILRGIADQAHSIVTVSETVRQLVIEHLGLSPERVTNTYQAIETPLQSDPPLPSDLRSGRYFFFCGRVERRKNLARLARALAESRSNLPLVIVGPAVDGEEELEAILRASPNVRRIAWVPRNELIGLMRRARALLFPSLAEGFGLPIVEAMTLGCPVLTSSKGAAAEIAGKAAMLVDPFDAAALAEAISRLDQDDALCMRLRAAGFSRGRRFTPELYARRLRALYASALASGATGASG